MKTFKPCSLALTLAAILLGVCPAHATITVLNYWHMGETDPQAAPGRYCTNTVDVVGRDTLTNNSVGGHYPTYTNGVSPAAAAETGSSLALVLTNGQYGTALLATNLADNFGIECWVNPGTTAPGGEVLAYNGLRGNGWGLYQNGTNYEVLYGGSAFWGNGLATTGVWTHLALVRSQGVATLYVNGAPASTYSGAPIPPTGSFTVGGDAQYSEYFSGAIDEVRVFTFAPGGFSTNDLLVNLTNLLVSNTKDSGAGSLRAATVYGPNNAVIQFTPALSGQTILLTGGQIELSNNMTIDGSALSGGIHIDGNAAVTVFNVATNTTVILNSLTITNGNAANGGGINNNGTLTLNQCTLSGNSAANYGGGIYNSATLILNECTLAKNSAGFEGGGIASPGGVLALNECTLVANNSVNGGGGILISGYTGITNTIVLNNSGKYGADIDSGTGTLAYGGENFIRAVSSFATITGPAPYYTSAVNLAPLGNYGGPTQTVPPLPGSLAIGMGSLTANTFTNDQRGFVRTKNGQIDIGAVESADFVPGYNYAIVTTANDFLSGLTNSGVSLRTAVFYATNTTTITFSSTLSGQAILLTNGLITLDTNLTIDASALPQGIQINGNGRVSVFNVASGINDVLDSLTITNGYTSGTGGGGIYNNGILTLNQCTLSGNNAYSGLGGGIYNNGTLTLNQCAVSGNNAYNVGGGIFSDTQGTLTLNECTLAGNSVQYSGGGIYNEAVAALNECTLSGNSQTLPPNQGGVGGCIVNGGTMTVTNCIIAGNSSANIGTDIYNWGGQLIYGSSNLIQSVGNNGGTITGPSPLNAAPGLAALRNYGGPTQTMPPLPGSPAIGAGSLAANTFATDQRGYARTQNGLIDIGAVELPTVQPFTASPTNDWQLNLVQFNSPGVDSDGTTIAEWNWSFGDGTTGAGQNTTHAYATTGIFSPGLIVTNSLGLALAVSGPGITVSLPPNATGITLSGTNLTIQGTGISGSTYYVLTSTNLALPLSQWTPLSTNTWSANGVFSVTLTNALKPPTPGQFYLLKE